MQKKTVSIKLNQNTKKKKKSIKKTSKIGLAYAQL